jgi:hypothetical protein
VPAFLPKSIEFGTWFAHSGKHCVLSVAIGNFFYVFVELVACDELREQGPGNPGADRAKPKEHR